MRQLVAGSVVPATQAAPASRPAAGPGPAAALRACNPEGPVASERGRRGILRAMRIAEFQRLIEAIYYERDARRGLAGTHMWFCEEVGELTRALRRGEREHLEGEFADVLAWLTTLASIAGIDLEQAALRKYAEGCPRCQATPCGCP